MSFSLTGYHATVSENVSYTRYNLFLWYQNFTTTSVKSFLCNVQLTSDSNSTVVNQSITAVPLGSDGVFFFQAVDIPTAYLNTWKVQFYASYSNGTKPVFASLMSSAFTSWDQPMYFDPPIATVSGQGDYGVSLSQYDINQIQANLPFVVPPNTYSETTPKVGRVYLEINPIVQPTTYGPWINGNYYDLTIKYGEYSVGGYQFFPVSPFASISLSADTLFIRTNVIPNHPAGQFPISPNYSCYIYDSNPNTTTPQNITFMLPLHPTINDDPGIMAEGIMGYWFDNACYLVAIDEQGKDPGALEAVDAYSGHPQEQGIYHHHAFNPVLVNWVVDTQVRVVGFSLDGFPIVAPYLTKKNGVWTILSTSDLDECHGIEKNISFVLDGHTLSYSYYYVCTFDFPYVQSAFRGTKGTYTRLNN